MVPPLCLQRHHVARLRDHHILVGARMDVSDHMDIRMVLKFFLIGFVDGEKQLIVFAAVEGAGERDRR